MNYQRKSTAGWSIGNIVLDSLGATFSLVQLVLDAYRYDDLVGGVFGNPSKLFVFFIFLLTGSRRANSSGFNQRALSFHHRVRCALLASALHFLPTHIQRLPGSTFCEGR